MYRSVKTVSAERLAQQHRSLSRCPAGVPPLAREQRLHKGEGVKGLQVVDALAHPHKLDGHAQLIHHADLQRQQQQQQAAHTQGCRRQSAS